MMKKLVCLLLCALLLTGVACADTLVDGGSATATATMTINTPEPEPEKVVAVEVNWGKMEFSYEADGSIVPLNGSNYVTVTNNSNVDVTVTCSLSNVAAGITGTVDNSGSSVDKALGAAVEGENAPAHTFSVSFSADESFDPTNFSGTLASVTVSVSAAK